MEYNIYDPDIVLGALINPEDPTAKIRRETATAIAASLAQHINHYTPTYGNELKIERLVGDAIALTDELLKQLGEGNES